MIAYIYILIISGQNVIWNRLLIRERMKTYGMCILILGIRYSERRCRVREIYGRICWSLRFSVHARDLSWEFGSAQFEEWVLKNRIVEKRYKNRRNFVIGFLILLFIFVAGFLSCKCLFTDLQRKTSINIQK